MQGGEQAVPRALEEALPSVPVLSATEAPSRAAVHAAEHAAMGEVAMGAHGAPAWHSPQPPCCLGLRAALPAFPVKLRCHAQAGPGQVHLVSIRPRSLACRLVHRPEADPDAHRSAAVSFRPLLQVASILARSQGQCKLRCRSCRLLKLRCRLVCSLACRVRPLQHGGRLAAPLVLAQQHLQLCRPWMKGTAPPLGMLRWLRWAA